MFSVSLIFTASIIQHYGFSENMQQLTHLHLKSKWRMMHRISRPFDSREIQFARISRTMYSAFGVHKKMSHKLNRHITMAKPKNHFPSTARATAATNCRQSRTALHLIWNDWEKKSNTHQCRHVYAHKMSSYVNLNVNGNVQK